VIEGSSFLSIQALSGADFCQPLAIKP